MKKTILVVIGILGFLMASCVTPKLALVFDEAAPVEKSAWISPVSVGTITSYNGIPVEWKSKIGVFEVYQIPAGSTVLEWNLDSSAHNFLGQGILFQYNFLEGKQYHFRPAINDGKSGFWIWEQDIGTNLPGTYNMNNSVGFFPFLNTNTGGRPVLQ